jgi:hypothetical protein
MGALVPGEIVLTGIPAHRLLVRLSRQEGPRRPHHLDLPLRIGEAFVAKDAPIEPLRDSLTAAAA